MSNPPRLSGCRKARSAGVGGWPHRRWSGQLVCGDSSAHGPGPDRRARSTRRELKAGSRSRQRSLMGFAAAAPSAAATTGGVKEQTRRALLCGVTPLSCGRCSLLQPRLRQAVNASITCTHFGTVDRAYAASRLPGFPQGPLEPVSRQHRDLKRYLPACRHERGP